MRFFAIFILVLSVGCSGDKTSKPKQEASSPKERFEAFVKDVQPKLGEVKYDIKKTDSLVSPYTAVLNFQIVQDITKGEFEAKNYLDVVARFALQNGKWKYTNLDGTIRDVKIISLSPADEEYRERFEKDFQSHVGRSFSSDAADDESEADEDYKIKVLRTCENY